MKSYKSFLITEKLQELQLLLEGYFRATDEFISKLRLLKSKSDVAYVLHRDLIDYPSNYPDKDLKQSWVDITDKDDMVSFLPELKAKEIDDPFDFDKRNEIKIGRLVISLLKLTGNTGVNDKKIEEFVNLYKSTFAEIGEEFEIVSGKDIPYWYDEENYMEDWGWDSLANSCMRNSPESYFDIYKDSETVRMLILTVKDLDGNKKLIGRALVWRPKISPNNITYFMDRVYTLRNSDIEKFNVYADEQGWLRKKYNNYDQERGMLFLYKGEEIKGKLVVNITNKDKDYPYCDTLQFLSPDKDEVSNIGYHNGTCLIDTYGDDEDCSECNGTGYEECDSCGGDKEIECPECYGSGEEDCHFCDGSGAVNCKYCYGDGELNCNLCGTTGMRECIICDGDGVDDGDECDGCDGDGEVECDKCEGEGHLPCPRCDSDGKVPCKDCEGDGSVTCEECDGDIMIVCPECDGLDVLCSDCTGLINKIK